MEKEGSGFQRRRVALVTGGSRGLGAAVADLLAGQGYTVIITSRTENELADTAAWLARHPDARVQSVVGDITSEEHRRHLADVVRSHGRLDLLINNASGLGPSPMPQLSAFPLDHLLQLFDLNVVAPIGLIQECLPILEATGGMIVNVTSDAAQTAYAGWGGYGATKAALELASRVLSEEVGEQGISVVTVDPGDLRTRMHQDAFPGEDISDRPLPEVTLPFWAWLFGQDRMEVNGQRFQAQGETWEVAA